MSTHTRCTEISTGRPCAVKVIDIESLTNAEFQKITLEVRRQTTAIQNHTPFPFWLCFKEFTGAAVHFFRLAEIQASPLTMQPAIRSSCHQFLGVYITERNF
jgi:hypothetical protein